MGDIYADTNFILTNIKKIYHILNKNYFRIGKDIEFDISLKRLMKFFNLGTNELALFCTLFEVYFLYNERPISIGIIADEMNINPLRFLEFRDEFKLLEEKGFIYFDSNEKKSSFSKFYRVPEGVINAIIKKDEKLLEKELRVRDKSLKYPEDISKKELFYSVEVKNEISKITEYLSNGNLEAIQNRLAENSMPKGICVMLYGAPGTGKTETVYQIAKNTGRSIFHVDLGSVISQWIGGTVNNLSNVFEKYNLLCKRSKMRGEEIPILLFNEADALFGKRIENVKQGSEIDANNTQAMLLDSIERQEGIIMVTTNLAGNFDNAFERRFLFKIKFERPSLEIKKKIWKSKVAWLKTDAVEHLALSYDFSGAEIENIARKSTMNEVLTGKRSSVKEIEEYCKTEKLEKNKQTRIGFGC